MNYLIQILAAVLLISSCNSSSSVNNNETPVATNEKKQVKEEGDNLITFKLNGETVKTSGWTISRFAFNTEPKHEWLNITSNMKVEKKTINLNLNGAVPGVYELGGSALKKQSHGSFYPDYLEDLSKSFSFSKGSFTITEIDTMKHTVNGNFSGIVTNIKGESLQISEGKLINGTLNWNVMRY